MKKYDTEKSEEAAMEAARERSAVPHLRDVLKREHNEAQKRPRNEAVEKWGPTIEEMIERDIERRRRLEKPLPPSFKSPTPAITRKKDEPDMDR